MSAAYHIEKIIDFHRLSCYAVTNGVAMKKFLKISYEDQLFLLKAMSGETSLVDNQPLYDRLYNFFLESGEMPYGVAKARTGDPEAWILARLEYLQEGGK